MSYISVIGEECSIHGVFSHLRTCSEDGGKNAASHVALNLTRTHDRFVRMLLLSASRGGGEHSNDLLRAMRKTMSSASLEEKEH